VLLALAVPGGARAHGDPASHYLEAELLYPAFANRPSQAVELRLLGLLQEAARRGAPIKVALVANEGDLTDDPAMLRAPQRYAEFVGRELGATATAPIVVVTPFGYGVSGPGIDRADARSLVTGLGVPRAQGDALARAAMAAVRQIARAGGRPLPANVPPAPLLGSDARESSPGGSNDLIKLAFLFGVTFAVLFLSFELWSRRGRRRGASHDPHTPRRRAPANVPLRPAPRSSEPAASHPAGRGAPPSGT
jgi:hypothetical protein